MNLDDLIIEAYKEDLPRGDQTTDSLEVKEYLGKAQLMAKEDLVLSGSQVFEACLRHIQPTFKIKWLIQQGQMALKGQTLAVIEGNLIELLKAERVALNFLGHLCGVATLTHCFVKQISSTKCKILDTRKTFPLFRDLEKQAVLDGGGHNHRRDLSSAVLIKENHIVVAGGIKAALERAQNYTDQFIEIEVKTLKELQEAIELTPHRIMLDNMSLEDMKAARELTPYSIELEASGNMSLDRVLEVAQTGVDYISVGAITHSAPQADISLLFNWS